MTIVTRLDPGLSGSASLLYSTCLGGSASERGLGIAMDGSGSAYLTGFTQSDDFPVSSAGQPTRGADQCSAPP